MFSTKTHYKYKGTYRLIVKGWRKIYQAHTKESWSSYIHFWQNFRVNKVMKVKEGYYVTIKKSMLQEDKAIFNMCASNNTVS